MTTIACKDGVIAYDSQVTTGGTITDDDYEKCHERKGVKFVMSGKSSVFAALQDAYFGGMVARDLAASAIVLDGEGVWLIGASVEDGFWKVPVSRSGHCAIGSGSDHALTAMDMGASAAEAVEMAKRRDTATGGRVRTLAIAGLTE